MNVIKCKDCKYYHKKWNGTETNFYEDYWCEWVEPDEEDYCSLAEAKDEAVDNLQIHYEKDERIAEMYDLYKLYCGMSESMQKAVKDIMIVANGGEIDD